MATLLALLNELESKNTNNQTLPSPVSKSSVGWHIEHALITLSYIIDALENATPEDYKWKFNLFKDIYLQYKQNSGRKRESTKISATCWRSFSIISSK